MNEEPAGNSHDPQAVAIKKVIDVIANDQMVPCKFLGTCQENIFHLFAATKLPSIGYYEARVNHTMALHITTNLKSQQCG